PSPSCSFMPPLPSHSYPLSLHDALPISTVARRPPNKNASIGTPAGSSHSLAMQGHCDAGVVKRAFGCAAGSSRSGDHSLPRQSRSEEHTSELQSLRHLVCRLLLEKKKNK